MNMKALAHYSQLMLTEAMKCISTQTCTFITFLAGRNAWRTWDTAIFGNKAASILLRHKLIDSDQVEEISNEWLEWNTEVTIDGEINEQCAICWIG